MTGDARGRAIMLVSRLIDAWKFAMVTRPSCPPGIGRHVKELQAEVGLMQSAGPEGDALARRWCFLYTGADLRGV